MDSQTWNSLLKSLPEPHILQTWEWGQVKAAYGWKHSYHVWEERSAGELLHSVQPPPADARVFALAQVLQRRFSLAGLSTGLNVLYVPKGPILRDWSEINLRRRVLSDLLEFSKGQRAIFIKIDPDVRIGAGVPNTDQAQEDPIGKSVRADLIQSGWLDSAEQIQFPNTVQIDLNLTEEALLAVMKQKTRYNIRLAAKHGVRIRPGGETDIPMLFRMYAQTAERDGFVIRPEAYYGLLWKTFIQAGFARPLIAEVDGEPIAALIFFWLSQRAWYLYGMSTENHREKMPNHLLQWEAMRLAKANGCQQYDLWGAPDIFDESDPLWGVYRFKEGLGGHVVRNIGAWDFTVRPRMYHLYTQILPRILSWKRARGKTRVKKSILRDI